MVDKVQEHPAKYTKDTAPITHGERKETMVHIRLDGHLITKMEDAMRKRGLSTRSAFMRQAIIKELERAKEEEELAAIEWKAKVARIAGSNFDER